MNKLIISLLFICVELLGLKLTLAEASLHAELKKLLRSEKRMEALQLLLESKKFNNSKGSEEIKKINLISRFFLYNKSFQIFQEGMNLITSKKYQTAIEKFEKALLDEPDNLEILLRLGQALMMESKYGMAVRYLKEAKRINPFDLEVRVWLGRAYHMNKMEKEAFFELSQVYESKYSFELLYVWLAESLSMLGQVSKAIKILIDDLKSNPLHLLSLTALARLRIQFSILQLNQEAQLLMLARQNLQLVLSRLDLYQPLLLSPSKEDLKIEVEKLLQQIYLRLKKNG